jgi:hypothetical protein
MKYAHCKKVLYKYVCSRGENPVSIFLCLFLSVKAYALSPEVFIIIILQISQCLIAKTLCHLYWYDKSLQRIWICPSIFSSSVFITNKILFYRLKLSSCSLLAPIHFVCVILGAFAKVAPIGFVMSVRLPVMYQFGPLLDGFPWNSILEISMKICRKTPNFLKIGQFTWTLKYFYNVFRNVGEQYY